MRDTYIPFFRDKRGGFFHYIPHIRDESSVMLFLKITQNVQKITKSDI